MTRNEGDTPEMAATGRPEQGAADGTHEIRVNTGYVAGQLARALTASREHADAGVRARAARKVDDWVRVFTGMLRGVLDVGSRTPVAGTPAWATLKVVTGGFATGELLADGPLQDHERELLARLGRDGAEGARAALNAHYLSEDGLTELQAMLESGRYRVGVPEEGALLAVAWLLNHGHADQARTVLDEIGPHFARLRFYPVPHPRPLEESSRVRVQDVGETVAALEAVPTKRVHLRQREAALVWAPLCDRAVQLLLETVADEPPRVRTGPAGAPERWPDGRYVLEGGWPCQRYPEGWAERARALLIAYERLRAEHEHCRRPERADRTFAQLRRYLRTCADDPAALTGRDVARIREMLAGFVHKRGRPGSARLLRLRGEQARLVDRPTKRELAGVLADRLATHPPGGGIESVDGLLAPVAPDEAVRRRVPAGQAFPASLELKVFRCLEAPAEALVERGVITSGEALARVVPQIAGQVRANSIPDPELRRLYGAVYRAFRRRRSLLLLNLRSQVKLEELPWVRPLEAQRTERAREREGAGEALAQLVSLTLGAFPEAILPNKLLQEIRALAEAAGLEIPIVDEVAADIFMGDFSEKFLRAAQRAGRSMMSQERISGVSSAQSASGIGSRAARAFRRASSGERDPGDSKSGSQMEGYRPERRRGRARQSTTIAVGADTEGPLPVRQRPSSPESALS